MGHGKIPNMDIDSPYAPVKRVLLTIVRSTKVGRDRLAGFLRYNLRTNWEITVFGTDLKSSTPAARARIIRDWKPDAIVFAQSCSAEIQAQLKGIPNARRPICICFDSVTPDPESVMDGSVSLDDSTIIHAALAALERRNVRHFAFLSPHGSLSDQHVNLRAEVFRREMKARGETESVLIAPSYTLTPNIRRIADWLSRLPKPCGVILYNDQSALPAYAACRLAGLSVPKQVFFIGVDNDDMLCENLSPPLSSILPDFENAGFLAARLLDASFRGELKDEDRHQVYGVKAVVERGSTLDVSGASRYVFLARQYLDQAPDGRISVTAVAAALNLSPRLLQKHFAACTGHTLQGEILDRRFARLCRLLKTTDFPIKELIDLCGWNSLASAKQLFKNRFGCSMKDYRYRPSNIVP